MKSRYSLGLLTGLIVVAQAAPAVADSAAPAPQGPEAHARSAILVQLGQGTMGRQGVEDPADPNTNRNVQPGYEQTTIGKVLTKDGKERILLVSMEGYERTQHDPENLGPVRGVCASIELHADGPPTIVTASPTSNFKVIAHNPGERSFHHPILATVDDVGVILYGADMGGNRTKTYGMMVDADCNVIAKSKQLSDPAQNDTQDNGAPHVVAHKAKGADGSYRFSGGYLSTGGDNDSVYYLGLKAANVGGLWTLDNMYPPVMTIPRSQIGRPTITVEGNYAVFIASAFKNNKRPPDDGIHGAVVDMTTGAILWNNKIIDMVSNEDPYKRQYISQPSVGRLAENVFALQVSGSNGLGKGGDGNRNIKGSNTPYTHMLVRNPQTNELKVTGNVMGAAAYSTHTAICTGKSGINSEPTVNVISASPIGIGRAESLILHPQLMASTPYTYDKQKDLWPINWYGDSGYLSNRYGRNPGRQGRNFLRCIGDVENPGYHKEKGFQADVKTFWVAAVEGRVPGDAKNSMPISLYPAEADTPSVPQNPVSATDIPVNTGDPGNPTATPAKSGGCGCSTPGTSSGAGFAGGLGLVGLAIAAAARRRRS